MRPSMALPRTFCATRNGIMLVSHIRHLREKEGVDDFREAVVRGATERLVPILMPVPTRN